MARRKDLKNAASGLLGSFISRNNDVGGYWGIGKLCLLAHRQGARTARLDLLEKSITPASAEFSSSVAEYAERLHERLAARDIPRDWLTSATIEVDFAPDPPTGIRVPRVSWGDLFKLTVTIVDDVGRSHAVSGYGYCAPHDSRRESRSMRGRG